MTILANVFLSVARVLGGTREGLATGGTTTTLVDSVRRVEGQEAWDGGSLVIKSGTYADSLLTIKTFSENTFTFNETLAGAIVSGVSYAAVRPKFPKEVIIMGINMALADFGEYVHTDETLVVDEDVQSYDLPDGVYGVKRVEVAGSEDSPYDYSINYYWRESDGKILFVPGKEPTSDGNKIRITYVAPHAEVQDADDEVGPDINISWLKWAATVNIYRDYYSIIGSDNQQAVQLMNEAIKQELVERTAYFKHVRRFMARDPQLASY